MWRPRIGWGMHYPNPIHAKEKKDKRNQNNKASFSYFSMNTACTLRQKKTTKWWVQKAVGSGNYRHMRDMVRGTTSTLNAALGKACILYQCFSFPGSMVRRAPVPGTLLSGPSDGYLTDTDFIWSWEQVFNINSHPRNHILPVPGTTVGRETLLYTVLLNKAQQCSTALLRSTVICQGSCS